MYLKFILYHYLFLEWIIHSVLSIASLESRLSYYEILTTDAIAHKIIKRGIQPSNHRYNSINELNVKMLGRNFRLFLSPSKDLLSSHFKIYSVDGKGNEHVEPIDVNSFYTGRVFGEVSSSVRAHLDGDILTATITVPDDVYVIEPLWHHLPNETDKMLAYKGSDIKYKFNSENHTEGHGPEFCASIKEDLHDEDQQLFLKYPNHSDPNVRDERPKRQVADSIRNTRQKCSLLLVADYRFYRQLGGSDTKKTANYLIGLIDRVNDIFENTEWKDGTSQIGIRNMGFVIKKILVHNSTTQVRDGREHYNMEKSDNWIIKHLLEVFSREEEHRNYCLAHLFTDQKFEGGILGLAYVGSPRRNSVGGICTPEYYKDGYVLNLNTGLSSSRNHYNQVVITREADLVTAHELGHNWGSEHDPDIPECSPSSTLGGSYIMYTYSVSGYDSNNKLFSPCSLRSVKAVLLSKAQYCFSEREESFCGNFKVEKGEECDAGIIGTSDSDLCCDKNCKFKPNVMCSDKNSPCCYKCKLRKAGEVCGEKSEENCKDQALCTGFSPECPLSPPLPDNSSCIERGQCMNGSCLPFYETKGLKSCICSKVQFINDNIVGAVIIFTLILWIPASCVVNYVDVKRKNQDMIWYNSEWSYAHLDSFTPSVCARRSNDCEIYPLYR